MKPSPRKGPVKKFKLPQTMVSSFKERYGWVCEIAKENGIIAAVHFLALLDQPQCPMQGKEFYYEDLGKELQEDLKFYMPGLGFVCPAKFLEYEFFEHGCYMKEPCPAYFKWCRDLGRTYSLSEAMLAVAKKNGALPIRTPAAGVSKSISPVNTPIDAENGEKAKPMDSQASHATNAAKLSYAAMLKKEAKPLKSSSADAPRVPANASSPVPSKPTQAQSSGWVRTTCKQLVEDLKQAFKGIKPIIVGVNVNGRWILDEVWLLFDENFKPVSATKPYENVDENTIIEYKLW